MAHKFFVGGTFCRELAIHIAPQVPEPTLYRRHRRPNEGARGDEGDVRRQHGEHQPEVRAAGAELLQHRDDQHQLDEQPDQAGGEVQQVRGEPRHVAAELHGAAVDELLFGREDQAAGEKPGGDEARARAHRQRPEEGDGGEGETSEVFPGTTSSESKGKGTNPFEKLISFNS